MMTMHSLRLFLLCVAALLALAAPTASRASPFAGGGVGDPIEWGPCDRPAADGSFVGLECARITVPLDWNEPNGRTISLAVIRLRASKPNQRIGTLFINPGGPGESGLELVQGDPEGIDAIGGGRFDVVSWDPRGTHASTRVLCFRNPRSEAIFWAGVSIPNTNTESERFARKSVDLAERCGEVSGWLLPHISTADTVRDLDHLRGLLGDEKLTYVGFSYGTRLALTAMRAAIDEQSAQTAYLWLPQLAEMRRLPEFKAYMREIGMVAYWQKYGWPQRFCQPLNEHDFACH